MNQRAQPGHVEPTPEISRHNGRLYILSNTLIYVAAPVVYVGVVQAALCDKLGASATVANLPATAFFLGAFAPLPLSWSVPHTLVRATVVVANLISAVLLALVCVVLFLSTNSSLILAAVIGQGLCQGFCAYTSQVFMFQCLKRGTTLDARARTLKWTFTFGPIAAVAGSLGTQIVLGSGISWLPYPYDFGLLYLLAAPCMAGVALLGSRYQLIPVEQEKRPSLALYLKESLAFFLRQRTLILIWIAYLLWQLTANSISNLSLYGGEVLGQDPKEFSGIVLMLRFGFKSLGGFILGVITIRWGIRAPLVVTAVLLGSSVLWGWTVPGYFYFLAFGLLGAGELGGAYFPNYVISISSPANAARNLSLLTLVSPVSGIGPAAHGALADLYGFPASFLFGLATVTLSLVLLLRLPQRAPARPDL